MSEYIVNFDGSVGPANPDVNAHYAYVITKNGKPFVRDDDALDKTQLYSNNYAEFFALYAALNVLLLIVEPFDSVVVKGDSQLVINMMTGKFKASESKLYYPAFKLAEDALYELKHKGIALSIKWIPRELNTEADKASKYRK